MTLLAKRTTKQVKPMNSNGKKKQAVLNKFLSKTYHMIDNCDLSIASWSAAGDCFTVKDIEAFEKEVVPKYFNHSKFSSFTRQLNFYGFQKMRSDADLQLNSNNSVRFCHEYFKRDQPELLNLIQRATASSSPSPLSPSSSSTAAAAAAFSPSQPVIGKEAATTAMDKASVEQVESLTQQVQALRKELDVLTSSMDQRIAQAATALQEDYHRRAQEMENHYCQLMASVVIPPSLSSSSIGAGFKYLPPRKRQSSE